jgi:signal transduction histidine kinase
MLVSSTAELLREDPALNSVRIEVEGSAPPVHADPGLLQIVFTNILMNAAQAIGDHGEISIRIARGPEAFTISVRDRGPGMPPEVREKVFEPFFTTQHRGTGLGLAIARRIVEAHGGTIAIETPADGGTVVIIALPAR